MAYPSYYSAGATPNNRDPEYVVLQRILGQVNNLLALFSPVSAQPSFYAEGNIGRKSDTRYRLLQKINGGMQNLQEAIIATGAPATLGVFNVALISDLRAIATGAVNKMATVRANTVAGDGMGGIYSWVSGNTDADDGIATIRPTDYTTGGTWKKLV